MDQIDYHTLIKVSMASYNYHLRPSTKKGVEEGNLFIRVIYLRQSKDISTSFTLRMSEWDETKGKGIYSTDNPERNKFLADVESNIHNDLTTLEITEKDLSRNMGTFTGNDLVDTCKSMRCRTSCLFSFCEKASEKLIALGQIRTARAYRSATRSLLDFKMNSNLSLEEIDTTLIRDYESYLKAKKLEKNTISFYIRNIRALYNRAVAEKLIKVKEENPFLNVCTGIYTSRKRALNLPEVQTLRDLQDKLDCMASEKGVRIRNNALALGDSLKYFNFCLQGRGMSWIDMVFLKKADLGEETFVYRRKKTGRKLEIIITEEMRGIINYFSNRTKNSPYVFPVINPTKGNERSQYETGLRTQNGRLRVLANMAGIKKKITTHVSRHTWATIARNINVAIPVISELLGHSDINVTYRYLDSIESQQVIQATEQVIKALNESRLAIGEL